MRLLQIAKVSELTVVRDMVDSKSSLMTVSVVVVIVAVLVVETAVVDVVEMISVMVLEIKTSQDSVCSCISWDLNHPQHFLNTEMATDRRLIARISSPTVLSRKKTVSDSKSYSSYSVQTHMSTLEASSCRWRRRKNRTYSKTISMV